ncbi:SDR family NAD(P)-dependent oxidoreductase [Paraburkholderia sediminicola]|uniref:SDR family NAD(P)-dependent oxidoreductase n=1 Tax=Paraburkholderia sediminicola TaxID=458836 RepID=UPI0038B74547
MSEFQAQANLRGKVAVITGAGRGIGRAIARACADAGAAVVCSARTIAEVQEKSRMIEAAGGRSAAVAADVCDYPATEALFAAAADQFGGIDIVVANAGVSLESRKVEHSDPLLWKQTVEVNLVGVFNTARAAIPHLRRRGAGKMILIGSGSRHRPNPGMSSYASSELGTWMLTQTLAVELQSANISVNELIPGPVRTAMTGFGEKFAPEGE